MAILYFFVVSMSRPFVDWVIENNFMVEGRMTIRIVILQLIPRILTSTQIGTCMYFISSRATTAKMLHTILLIDQDIAS